MVRKKDPYAPWYHLYTGAGWMNDPCGCNLYKGEYHIFFQYHERPEPLGPGKWYHMKSRDLQSWEELGICLQPEFDYEKNGCWTGSSLEKDGIHYIFYSTNQDGRIPQQQPGMAYSRDGIHYQKFNIGPVITEATPDGHLEMRDPKVFIRDGCWYLLQGASRDGRGELVGYKSTDGIRWEYQGCFFSSEKWMGSMFECPDFFSIGDRDFLIISPMDWPGHKNVILCGKADFETFTFRCDKIEDLDLGSDFYAAQSIRLKDGRVAVVGWLNSWGKPHPEVCGGWAGMLSCLRTVEYQEETGKVFFSPMKEMELHRIGRGIVENLHIAEDILALEFLKGAHKEILIELPETRDSENVVMVLSVAGREETAVKLTLDFARNLICVDKTKADRGDNSNLIYRCRLHKNRKLRLFIDGSALELFTGDGQVISERFYADTDELRVLLHCGQGQTACRITSYDMGSLYRWEE